MTQLSIHNVTEIEVKSYEENNAIWRDLTVHHGDGQRTRIILFAKNGPYQLELPGEEAEEDLRELKTKLEDLYESL